MNNEDFDKQIETAVQSPPPELPVLEPLATRKTLAALREQRITYLEEVETALHKRIAELKKEVERLKKAVSIAINAKLTYESFGIPRTTSQLSAQKLEEIEQALKASG